MKYRLLTPSLLLLASTPALAAVDLSASGLIAGIVSTIIYGAIGIAMATLGYFVVDWMTPGNLREQIAEHENQALAILTGAMVLGVCIIIAAVLVG